MDYKCSGDFYKKIAEKFESELRGLPSAVKRETAFRGFLESIRPKRILEIGTCAGVSAALMAQYADKVYTIDHKDYDVKYKIWEFLGIRDKIESFIIKTEQEKAELCKKLNFDLAYIDGDHSYEGIKSDFECVKDRCTRILFDDYKYESSPGVTKFIDEIQGYRKYINEKNCFAYLEKFKFDIVIGTYKRIPKIVRLLESIKPTFKRGNFGLYIYIDNDDQDSYLTLKTLPVCEELGANIILMKGQNRIFGIWNHHLKGMNADAAFMLGDDVEFINDGLIGSMNEFLDRVSDMDGFMGIKAGDGMGKFCHPASFGIVGNKFADRFVNRKIYCPDYTSHFGDPELCDYAKSVNKFYYTNKTYITHHKEEHIDDTFKSTVNIRAKDKAIYLSRKEKGYLWGKNFARLNTKTLILFPSSKYSNAVSAQYKSLKYGMQSIADVQFDDRIAEKSLKDLILFQVDGKQCAYDYGDAGRLLKSFFPEAAYFKTQCRDIHVKEGVVPLATGITDPEIYINVFERLRENADYKYDVLAIFRNSDYINGASRRQKCVETIRGIKGINALSGLQRFRNHPDIPDGLKTDKLFYEEYLWSMSRSKIVIGLPGCASINFNGWCWRDMETLGMGRLLITVKSPLVRPGNFWECCVTVKDDLSDLTEKIDYYLKNELEREDIARKGREYFDKYINPVRVAEYIIETTKESR